MIQKIGAGAVNYNKFNTVNNTAPAVKSNVMTTPASVEKHDVTSLVNAYKAYNGISFKGLENLSPLEQSIICDKELRIPNLLTLTEPIHISPADMPENKLSLNAAGLNVDLKEKDGYKYIFITNDQNDKLVNIKYDKTKQMPVIVYKQGKFMPEITIKDTSLDDKKVKMFAGSKMIGDGFEIEMPGAYEPIPGKRAKKVNSSISFKGNVTISTLNKENRTEYAFNKWYDSDLPSKAITGDFASETQAYDPNAILLMGGFGERFRNITRERENKPSAKLPTNDKFRIMATTLNLAASAGLLGNRREDNITYLSQAHTIKGDNVYEVTAYKTDGGAIAEGLARNIIRNDKDNIILNGDIFTNADITRVYHALKNLPDAGLVIPYYPVNPERAKSFGMLGVEKDDNGNLQIKSFIEKPKYTNKAPMPQDFTGQGEYDKAFEEYKKVQKALLPGSKQTFLANPGLYFISQEASKVLMAAGILDSNATGLGKDIMPKIVKLANEGKLKDKEGNNLKVYTVPLEAKGGNPAVWEDIGTAEAYLKVIKDVAAETVEHGTSEQNRYYGMPKFVLEDFAKNVDLNTGIVYGSEQSKQLFDEFRIKYGVQDNKVYGNIFVTID